jgi:hypothetical protein
MAPNTRNMTRNLHMLTTDVEMEDANTPLTLPAPQSYEVVEHTTTSAIQPMTHAEPTLQPMSAPHSDLTTLLADIPSTVHIENLSFSIAQHQSVHEGVDVAALEAYVY